MQNNTKLLLAKKGTRLLLRMTRSIALDLHDAMRARFDQYIPLRPKIMQFPIIGYCNSGCVMCGIWKNPDKQSITPAQLETVLRDKLFTRIQYVGLNGGEPTLRKDIEEFCRVLTANLPALKSAGMITNCVIAQKTIDSSIKMYRAFAEGGVQFAVTISLDGIGNTHDLVRGKPGNYKSCLQVIEALNQNSIPYNLNSTITPHNAYEADDLLLFAREHGIHLSIKCASKVIRLYNEFYEENNEFSPEQKLHLALFFDKMSKEPGYSSQERASFRDWSRFMGDGSDRSVGCYWQGNSGVTLDYLGRISYCSVASALLGSALTRSGWKIYAQNLKERRRINRENCPTCHHLMGRILMRDSVYLHSRDLVRGIEKFQGRDSKRSSKSATSWNQPVKPQVKDWKRILVVGWWGTETAGDKAILRELLSFLGRQSPNAEISVSTLNRWVTAQTSRELEIAFAQQIPLEKCSQRSTIAPFDAVIIGGGPLMDLPQMRHIRDAFSHASESGAARVIFGCGMGPLRDPICETLAFDVCRLASHGFFRDAESLASAQSHNPHIRFHASCDPAIAWITQSFSMSHKPADPPCLAFLMRANTSEYIRDGFFLESRSEQVATLCANTIDKLTCERGLQSRLLAMHSIPQGGDDRLYARKIAVACSASPSPYVQREYLALDPLLGQIGSARLCVAMRYHAHIFCLALGIPFVSIDYTGDQGKVSRLMQRINAPIRRLDWNTFDQSQLGAAIDYTLIHENEIRGALLQASSELVDGFLQTLQSVFCYEESAAAS